MNPGQTDKIWKVWESILTSAPKRFAKYGQTRRDFLDEREVGPSALRALAIISWNIALAESLTPILHAVELSLRNFVNKAVIDQLRDEGHQQAENWLLFPQDWLASDESELVDKAKQKFSGTPSHDDLVAALPFVFWTKLVENSKAWSAMAASKGGTVTKGYERHDYHLEIERIRTLRNRAYHLEPICYQNDLDQVHELCQKHLGRINERSRKLIAMLDRFPHVYAQGNGWERREQEIFSHFELDKIPD